MLSASQLGFVSSWRRNLEFAVRNALCFFSGNEMGPLKPRQLSCLKNSGVPWQNSRLWQKNEEKTTSTLIETCFYLVSGCVGSHEMSWVNGVFVSQENLSDALLRAKHPIALYQILPNEKWQFNLIQEQAKNCTVYSLPILILTPRLLLRVQSGPLPDLNGVIPLYPLNGLVNGWPGSLSSYNGTCNW